MLPRLALLSALIIALAPAAAAQIAVRGDWVSLGDVAPVTGDAAQMLLAPAPALGETLSLDPKFVVEAAKRGGVSLALPLDQPIKVTRAGGAASKSSSPQPTKAAAPALPPQAPKPAAAQAAPAMPPAGQVLVVAHDVPRGAKLSASDLDWAPPPAGLPLHAGPHDMDNAIGQEARRLLRAGSVVSPTDLKAPTLIHKGEAVTLVFISDGMRLSLEGQAQGDASEGEPVRVLNKASKRQVDAIASAEGEARVSK